MAKAPSAGKAPSATSTSASCGLQGSSRHTKSTQNSPELWYLSAMVPILPKLVMEMVFFVEGRTAHVSDSQANGRVCENLAAYSDKLHADTLSYKLNFVEPNNRNVSERWSSRHLGVYHQHESEFDLYVLVHCSRSSALYGRFMPKSMSSHGPNDYLQDVSEDPESLHGLILQAYVHNWRPYLRAWGNELSRMVGPARI